MSAFNFQLSAVNTWLVTGCAGFIGSNLVEALLKQGHHVVGLDNFSTGHKKNIEAAVRADQADPQVSGLSSQVSSFTFIEGDLRDLETCQRACTGVDYVLHQAALGSVPRSLKDPIATHESNVTGFLNMLVAARDQKVKRFVYASSSSVYGDHPDLPKVEENVGHPLSPYAATKAMNEMYAAVFARAYGLETIGLRYFNVFGPRQDPNGAYAAVIPKWIAAMLTGEPITINGDGETSRDFCYIENVIQANLLAATVPVSNLESQISSSTQLSAFNSQLSDPTPVSGFSPQVSPPIPVSGLSPQVFNIAVGERTTLNELYALLKHGLQNLDPTLKIQPPIYKDFRAGDVRHSLADITKARTLLGYAPTHRIVDGLACSLEWYKANTQPVCVL